MIEIRASADELDISGTRDELRSISDGITQIGTSTRYSTPANPSALATPYDRCLSDLKVELGDGLVVVSVVDDSLLVCGLQEGLISFASYFIFDERARPGSHWHFDDCDNQFVSPVSLALTVTIR
jgi:hypothetical protein